MGKITLADAMEPTIVELWEHEYTAKAMTKSLSTTVDKLEEKLDGTETSDALVAAFGEYFDAVLERVKGSSPKPSALIQRKWDADDVTLGQLIRLRVQINGAASFPN